MWLHGFPLPGAADLAARAQAWGFTGLFLADSEILVGDPYVELALAVRATTTLRLGPAVTNPVTRVPAVTASALLTLQVESGGRIEAVIGRGDSAVAQLGLAPATGAALESAVQEIRGHLGTGGPPTGPRMAWADRFAAPGVPVAVAASGPVTIALAARCADGVDLTVGADPDRLAAAVRQVRTAAAGRDVRVGAFVDVAVHEDVGVARDLVRGSAAIFAHFVARGPLDGLPPADRAVVERLGRAYAEAEHGLRSAAHAASLPDAFLDRFAVVGPPAECTRRLRELFDLGLNRIIVVPGSRDADPALLAASDEAFATRVLPALR
ncbi:TIGR03842 family LLM class F420-dependent oxidoreductase [Nakamurella flavida]